MNNHNSAINIIFVDDEPMILSGIKRSLSGTDPQWSISFTGSGAEALDIMSATHCDVIVSDFKMPDMDGMTLLENVRQNDSSVIRFFLSAHIRKPFIFDTLMVAHAVFLKPCSSDVIKSAVLRWLKLREAIPAGKIRDVVFGSEGLPVLPETHRYVKKMREAGSLKQEEIYDLSMKDPGFAARCLRLAGGVARDSECMICDIKEALTFLQDDGLMKLTDPDKLEIIQPELAQTVREKLLAHENTGMKSDVNTEHAKRAVVAAASRDEENLILQVADPQSYHKLCSEHVKQEVVVAVLRNIGKLVLLLADPMKYEKLSSAYGKNSIVLGEWEKSAFGISHADVGACLGGMWELREDVVKAVKLC